jgi:TRAP-type C4-dicarboxylate transport system substrate-binding protein
MLKSGVSDIGWIIFSFYRGVFPLSEVMSQPGLVPKEGRELDYYNAMFDKYLHKEFSEVKPFIPHMLGSTYINTKNPVRKLEDLQGMQIRCGSSQKAWLKTIGGTPATLPPSELYTALERGIVDGCTFPMDGVKSFKLFEVTRYHTPTNLGLGMGVVAMNKKVWSNLPSDIQNVFMESNPWLQQKMYSACIEAGKEAVAECLNNKSEVIQLSDEQKAKLHQLTFPLAEEWAKTKDAKGLPGTEVLNYAKTLLSQ